jgi:hypothetical protein
MLKRVSWFVTGAVAGIAGAGFAKRKVKQTAAQLAPANIAKSAAGKVREKAHDVADAVRDGREAMRAKESELRVQLADDRPADDATGSDEPTLHDQRAESGRVIVIDEVRDQRDDRDDHVGPRRTSRRGRRGG